MNKFAWSVTFEWNIDNPELPFKYILNKTDRWDTLIFCLWETEITSSMKLIDFIKEKVWSVLVSYDISIETEDKIRLIKMWKDLKFFTTWTKHSKYEMIKKVWIDFETVVNNFQNEFDVVSIREAEEDIENWWRIIKIDTLI